MILLSLGCCSVCTSGLYCRLFVVAVFVSVDDIVGSCSGCTSVRETQVRAASHWERTPVHQTPAQPAPTQDVVRHRHHATGHVVFRGNRYAYDVKRARASLYLLVTVLLLYTLPGRSYYLSFVHVGSAGICRASAHHRLPATPSKVHCRWRYFCIATRTSFSSV